MTSDSAVIAGGTVLGRRSLLLAVGVTGLGVLGGCDSGAQPERDTTSQEGEGPTTPAAPTQPLADTDLLLRTWERTRELRATAGVVRAQQNQGRAVAETERVLGIQEAVLERLLRAQHGGTMPRPGDASGATGVPDAAAQTVTPRPDVAELAAALSPVEEMPQVLSRASGSNLPTLMSLHGVRYACAERLGSAPDWGPLAGPNGAAAVTLLAGLRQAVYGFEALAARSDDAERERYGSVLSRLRPLTRTVTELAGPAAPAAPLGYGWDRRLASLEDRRRAAAALAGALPAAVMAGASARAGNAEAIAGTLRLLAAGVGAGVTVGVAVSGFPGLTVPEATR